MTEPDDRMKYVCMAVNPWVGSKLRGATPEKVDGCTDGSIGFMPVFDDVDKLKAAYPGAEIMKVLRMRD